MDWRCTLFRFHFISKPPYPVASECLFPFPPHSPSHLKCPETKKAKEKGKSGGQSHVKLLVTLDQLFEG